MEPWRFVLYQNNFLSNHKDASKKSVNNKYIDIKLYINCTYIVYIFIFLSLSEWWLFEMNRERREADAQINEEG